MDKLLEILKEAKPNVDFSTEKALIDGGVFDSFDVLTLVMKLNEAFNIEISADLITPANFNSAENLWAMVQSLQ